jgi:hypothetical protein
MFSWVSPVPLATPVAAGRSETQMLHQKPNANREDSRRRHGRDREHDAFPPIQLPPFRSPHHPSRLIVACRALIVVGGT